MGYAVVVVAPDGDYVIAHHGETVEECIQYLVNRTSQHFFYPGEFVIDEVTGVVVDDPYEKALVGLRLPEAARRLSENWEKWVLYHG